MFSGVFVVVVVGFLIIFFLVILFLYFVIKKVRKNVKVYKWGSVKYVNDLNILFNGKVVIIGRGNKGFEDEIG